MKQSDQERLQDVSLRYFDHLENQIQLVATKATILVAATALVLVLGAYLDYATRIQIFPVRGFTGLDDLAFAAGGLLLLLSLASALYSICRSSMSRA